MSSDATETIREYTAALAATASDAFSSIDLFALPRPTRMTVEEFLFSLTRILGSLHELGAGQDDVINSVFALRGVLLETATPRPREEETAPPSTGGA
ncbi:hypothetical protein ACFQHO_53625 [Actinomadura yumaensis]|uniref:hypothetical protein n=1 Tax=Actinomadura yumaensis TaxID=111807 RepID=UPI00361E63CD